MGALEVVHDVLDGVGVMRIHYFSIASLSAQPAGFTEREFARPAPLTIASGTTFVR